MNKILIRQSTVEEITPLSEIVGLEYASYIQLTMKDTEKAYKIKTPGLSSVELSGKFQLQIDESNFDLSQLEIGSFDGYIEVHY